VAVREMRAQAVPTLHTIDAIARSLDLAARLAGVATPPAEVADPLPGVPVTCGYLEARELLGEYAVAFPAAAAVRTEADVPTVTAAMAPPFVLKAGWLEHKTEAGGVAVGLPDPAAVTDALAGMRARLGDGDYVVEELDARTDVVELIVGARRDPSFGPVVLVGAGGVQAELHRDVALALAPVTTAQAADLLRSLVSAPLLAGWRGRPAVDLDAAAAVVAAVSRLLAEHPEVAECEVNPLRVGPDGAVAVDALVVALEPASCTDADTGSARPEEPSLLQGARP
jgi:acyl-CoA synthetase (NDP forming)